MSYGYGYPPAPPGYEPDAPPGYAPPRSAPKSVRLVATMHYLIGLALLVYAALLLTSSIPPEAVEAPGAVADLFGGEPYDGSLVVAGAAVIGGLLAIAIGRKLRQGRRWIRLVVLAVSCLDLAATLYTGVVLGERTNALLGVVVPVLYLVLLNLPAARAWFRYRPY